MTCPAAVDLPFDHVLGIAEGVLRVADPGCAVVLVESAADDRLVRHEVGEDVGVPFADPLGTLLPDDVVRDAVAELVLDDAHDLAGVGASAAGEVEVDRSVPVGVAGRAEADVGRDPGVGVAEGRVDVLEEGVNVVDRPVDVLLVLLGVGVGEATSSGVPGVAVPVKVALGPGDVVQVDVRAVEVAGDGAGVGPGVGNRPVAVDVGVDRTEPGHLDPQVRHRLGEPVPRSRSAAPPDPCVVPV